MKEDPEKYYRWFDHTADLGMEIFGEDAAHLFANAGRALSAGIVSVKRAPLLHRHTHELTIEGEDWADLMVNWLRELLYLWNGRQQIVHRFQFRTLVENRLSAVVVADAFDPERHCVEKEIKAVTYHQIEVRPESDGWRARVVFDV